jgi:hypothetical protein
LEGPNDILYDDEEEELETEDDPDDGLEDYTGITDMVKEKEEDNLLADKAEGTESCIKSRSEEVSLKKRVKKLPDPDGYMNCVVQEVVIRSGVQAQQVGGS